MDKDLLKFENRSDDWLAKQKKEESYISAWDFDEGRKIKESHQDNCEARQIKEQHEYKHQMYNKKVQEFKKDVHVSPKARSIYLFVAMFVMFVFLILVILMAQIFDGGMVFGFIPIFVTVFFIALLSGRRKNK